jgi:ribonuclease P protein component
VQEGGRRFPGTHFLLLARPRPVPTGRAGTGRAAVDRTSTRLGITVSRKIGGAVQRNRVKRWVRESYRRLRLLAPPGMDLVVIARTGAPDIGLQATRAELEALLRRLGRR